MHRLGLELRKRNAVAAHLPPQLEGVLERLRLANSSAGFEVDSRDAAEGERGSMYDERMCARPCEKPPDTDIC